ncbi:MAG: hypothetical protein EOM87_02280 [Clostridia bacterium]|nr:hypothetical protein [Clostridia bacterium]
MTEVRTIKYIVKASQRKQYLKIPFEVPENVEKMIISYAYPGDFASSLPSDNKSVIDFALLDNTGKEVGATGSSHRTIVISPNFSTPGYNACDVNSGVWTIICGAYMIQFEELEITYTIEFFYKHYRWLKGDLHLHTVSSDGKYTIEELSAKAVKSDYDFITITDHNNFFHMKRLPSIPNLTIIPGVELSHYNGHMNFWGLEVPYTKPYCVNTFDEFKELHAEARERGAIISINHPFCSLCPWRWDIDQIDFNTVEVWNGPMRPDNIKAYNWWHQQLLKGRKLPAVGGSDYHKDRGPKKLWGIPTTYVYARSASKEDILQSIKEGRICTSKDAKHQPVTITAGDKTVGDTVSLADNGTVEVNVPILPRNNTLTVYNNDKIIYRYKSKARKAHYASIKVTEKGFVRAEITYRPSFSETLVNRVILYVSNRDKMFMRLPDFIHSFTNPIYFK